MFLYLDNLFDFLKSLKQYKILALHENISVLSYYVRARARSCVCVCLPCFCPKNTYTYAMSRKMINLTKSSRNPETDSRK